ncbi:MAG: hypothetical protein B6I20_01945 [Bacteroidetes bacterium 4572_117]|nr:MAG: hypothetical protein B6I20_01945 [Bacteroidetes bacterium 4572_117]
MNYNLTEIFNIEELKQLCESFTQLTGVATAILDLKGNIHVATGWQPICTQFHRINDETKKHCHESDTILAGQLKQGQKYNIYKCKNGLTDVAMPIIVGDKHIANFFTGQFLTEKPDIEFFRKQAKTYSFPEQEYLIALDKVQVYSEVKVKKNIAFLVKLAETIGNIGLKSFTNKEDAKQLELEKIKLKKSNKEFIKLNEKYKIQNKDLSEAKDRLKKAQKAAQLGNWELDLVKNKLTWSDEIYRMFELKPQEFEATYEAFLNIIHPADREKVNEAYTNSLKTKLPYKIEHRLLLKSGKIKHVVEKCDTEYDSTGKPLRSVGMVLDITSQIEKELALKESEANIRSFMENAKGFGVYSVEIAKNEPYGTRTIFASPSIKEILGIDNPEDNASWFANILPCDVERVTNAYNISRKTGFIFSEMFQINHQKKKELRWIHAISSPVIASDGTFKQFNGLIVDITERKNAEQALKESEEKYRGVIENMIDGFYKTDVSGNAMFISPSVTKILGYSEDEVLGKPIASFYAHPVERGLFLEKIKEKGKVENYQAEFIRKGKSNIIIETNAQIIYKNGKYDGVEGVFRDVTERIQEENKLIELEKRFHTVLTKIQPIVFMFDKDGKIQLSEGKMLASLGLKPGQLVGKNAFELYKESKEIIEAFNSVLNGNEYNGFIEIDKIIFDSFYSPKYDLKGNVNGVIGIATDITKQKHAEQALKESEKRYKAIFKHSYSIMILIEPDSGQIVDANKAASDFYGYSIDEITQMNINQINTLSTEEVLQEMRQAKNEKRNKFFFKHKLANKQIRDVEVYSGKIQFTEKEYLYSIIYDITDRKKAEQDLLIERDNLKNIFNAMEDGIYIVNQQLDIQYVNPTLIREFGSYQGKKCHEYFHNKNETCDWCKIKEVLAGKTVRWEWYSEKNKKTYDLIDTPLVNSDGTISKLEMFRDITDRKHAEQEIQKQNKQLKELNSTKDKFFSIISHDLKSPFNAILGFSKILLRKHKEYDDEKREEVINLVNKSAKNAFKLLENLLTWSLSQSGKMAFMPEKLHLKILLHEAIFELQAVADKKGIQVFEKVSDDELIYADNNLITTILRNLISNAIKFTNKNGIVVIASEKQKGDDFVKISVTDTGVGIPKDTIDGLFGIDKNTSTEGTENETGTGLGLILCKEFTEKHGGEIWVESEIGKGSSFYFTIPCKSGV